MLFEDVVSMRKRASLTELEIVKEIIASREALKNGKQVHEVDEPSSIAKSIGVTVENTTDTVWVERSIQGTYIVVRRTQLQRAAKDARYYASASIILHGEFRRRNHADRWARALSQCERPRYTRRLERLRAANSHDRTVSRCG